MLPLLDGASPRMTKPAEGPHLHHPTMTEDRPLVGVFVFE